MGRLKTNSERNAEDVRDLLKDYWEVLEPEKDSENQPCVRGKRSDARKRNGAHHDD